MYFGQHQTVLDDKGRITVPRRFRDVMRSQDHITWYMTRGYDGNLNLYHRDGWESLLAQIQDLPSMDPRVHDFQRLVFGSAAEVRVDGQGRMPVPQHLRALGGLEREAVLVGMKDRLELWNKEAWETFQNTHGPKFRDMVSELVSSGELGVATEKGGTSDEHRPNREGTGDPAAA